MYFNTGKNPQKSLYYINMHVNPSILLESTKSKLNVKKFIKIQIKNLYKKLLILIGMICQS